MTTTESSSAERIAPSQWYVRIRYQVRIENGPILRGGGEPATMDFVTGYGQVIPGLERRLTGHSLGEKLSFTVPAEEAFGLRTEELVFEKKKTEFHFPPGIQPHPGMEIPVITGADGPETVMISEIRDETIVIDCNHPLCGKALQYDLEIVEARPARETDVCAEWEEKGDACTGSPHQMILGQSEEP